MGNRHKFMTKQQSKVGSGTHKARLAYGNPDVVAESKKRKEGGKIAGKAAGGRLDRKRGGSIKSPFSSVGGGSASKSPFFK